MRGRRHAYLPTAPGSASEPNFGASFSTPDPFALTTRLYVRFGMRVTSLANSTAHQVGQWGAIGSLNQSWGYSFHLGGFPRLAVYPSGDNPSLIGIQSSRSFADVLGPKYATPPFWIFVAALVDLNVNNAGTTRRFAYWCGGHSGLVSMDDQSEAGATTFFNSDAAFKSPGYVGSACDRYTDIEIRETPGGAVLVRPWVEHTPTRFTGSFGGGPDTWVGPDGRTYTLGAFGDLLRSQIPRPYAA